MPELGAFAQIAPYLTHPLVLAGFALLLCFGLLRAVLKSRVMPTVSQSAGGRALLALLRYGFVLALVVIVLGFALAFRQAERTTVDADQIIRDFKAATERAAASEGKLEAISHLEELQDTDFRAAVVAIVREQGKPGATPDLDQAIEMLRQGETGAAEAALAGILDRRLRVRATAGAEAAEAARNLGAIAYLNDTGKAIEAFRTASELDRDDTWSWIYLGRLYRRVGDLAAADQAFQKAKQAAERAESERDVMAADSELGDVRVARGDLAGAVAAYEAGLATARKLAAQDPSNSGWQRDLSVSFEKIGDVQSARGSLDAALEAFQDSLAIRMKLAAQDPSNSEWQRDLSVSFNKIGDVQSARGNLDAALEAYQDGLAIAEKLAAQDPSNSGWQRDLSVSFEKIGDVQRARGNLDAAFEAYQDRHAIAEKLAAQDPSNSGWQRDLSVSFDRIGDVQSARGNLDAALEAYQDGLAIREKLAAQDPSNSEWQRDLSVSFEKIGDVQRARGNLDAAFEAYQDRHAIAEKLAAQDPSNSGWQRDLIVSPWRLADLAEQQREEAAARRYWRAALAIAKELETSGRLAPVDAYFVGGSGAGRDGAVAATGFGGRLRGAGAGAALGKGRGRQAARPRSAPAGEFGENEAWGSSAGARRLSMAGVVGELEARVARVSGRRCAAGVGKACLNL